MMGELTLSVVGELIKSNLKKTEDNLKKEF